MSSSMSRFAGALDILRSQDGSPSLSSRTGRAINFAIPSDVAAIEVFTMAGEYAGREWASPEPLVARHFQGFLRHRVTHPFFDEFVRTGLNEPVCISDFTGMRRLRSSGIYTDFFQPLGIQRQMGVSLPMGVSGVPVLVLGRSGSDYTERERQLLSLVIAEVRAIASTESLRDRYKLLTATLMSSNAALILVDPQCRIEYATDRAHSLLDQYFGTVVGKRKRLPVPLVELLQGDRSSAATSRPFAVKGHLRLSASVHWSASGHERILDLQEQGYAQAQYAQTFNLTFTEARILELMTRGLTNKEIATLVEKSVHTVRTQVESVLSKLSVPNRTMAAVLAHTLCGREEVKEIRS